MFTDFDHTMNFLFSLTEIRFNITLNYSNFFIHSIRILGRGTNGGTKKY